MSSKNDRQGDIIETQSIYQYSVLFADAPAQYPCMYLWIYP